MRQALAKQSLSDARHDWRKTVRRHKAREACSVAVSAAGRQFRCRKTVVFPGIATGVAERTRVSRQTLASRSTPDPQSRTPNSSCDGLTQKDTVRQDTDGLING